MKTVNLKQQNLCVFLICILLNAVFGAGCAVKFNFSNTGTATLTLSDGANYDYGTQTLSTNTDHTFTVTNTGTGTATLGTISTAGLGLSGGFAYLAGGTCATGSTLAANATCTLIVRYSPTTIGPQTESIDLTYTTNGSSKTSSRGILGSTAAPTVTFTTPAADGTLAVASSSSTFAVAGACTTSSGTVTISNASGTAYKTTTCTSGAWSTTIDLSSLADGAVSLSASQTENTLTGSASRSVTVTQGYCVAHAADTDLVTSRPNYPAGTGTSGDPYLICHVAHLNDIANRVAGTKYFKLMNDINIGGANFTAITGFADDTFDGNSLTISNAVFIGASQRGLFDQINGASYVHHLTLSGCSVTTMVAETGILAGKIVNTSGTLATIDHINVTNLTINHNGNFYVGGLSGWIEGKVAVSNIQVTITTFSTTNATVTGGLAGDFYQGGGPIGPTLTDASVTGNISGKIYVGGVVGWMRDATILRATYAGTVTSTQDNLGGVVGYIGNGTASITYSSSSGTVSGPGAGNYAGGLIGFSGTGTTVGNSYSSSTVSASPMDQVGGLIGGGTVVSLDKSYATGAVTGHNEVGGLTGDITGTITKSYATGNVSGNDNVGGLIAGSAATVSVTDAYAWGSVTSTTANKSYGASAGASGVTMTRVYAKGAVAAASGNNGFAANLVGSTNNFWNTTTTGQSANTGSTATGLSDTASKDISNYTGFTASTNWKLDTAISLYPILQWQ